MVVPPSKAGLLNARTLRGTCSGHGDQLRRGTIDQGDANLATVMRTRTYAHMGAAMGVACA